jgi:outer membrane protein OmpA-like peptidoglycan-associated protein
MQTLSYGEERPLEGGHEERSWARNRRGDFVITGGLPGGN